MNKEAFLIGGVFVVAGVLVGVAVWQSDRSPVERQLQSSVVSHPGPVKLKAALSPQFDTSFRNAYAPFQFRPSAKVNRAKLLLDALSISGKDKYIIELKTYAYESSNLSQFQHDLKSVDPSYNRYIVFDQSNFNSSENSEKPASTQSPDKCREHICFRLIVGPFPALREAQAVHETLLQNWQGALVRKLNEEVAAELVFGRNDSEKLVSIAGGRDHIVSYQTRDGHFLLVRVYPTLEDYPPSQVALAPENRLFVLNLRSRYTYNIGAVRGVTILPDQKRALLGIVHDLRDGLSYSYATDSYQLSKSALAGVANETGISERELSENLEDTGNPTITTLYILDLVSGKLKPLPLIGGSEILSSVTGKIYVARSRPRLSWYDCRTWYDCISRKDKSVFDIETVMASGNVKEFNPLLKTLNPLVPPALEEQILQPDLTLGGRLFEFYDLTLSYFIVY